MPWVGGVVDRSLRNRSACRTFGGIVMTLGIPETESLRVHHDGLVVLNDPDIGEYAPIAVPLLHVEVEAAGAASHEAAVHLGRLSPAWLLASRRRFSSGVFMPM